MGMPFTYLYHFVGRLEPDKGQLYSLPNAVVWTDNSISFPIFSVFTRARLKQQGLVYVIRSSWGFAR